MAQNPNPTRISSATWWFWEQFDALEPSAVLGGVYANKGGYHNYRFALPSYDYSVGQVSTDRADNGQFASAIDLTMSDAAMRRYSGRLHSAAANRDARLFIGGQAIMREYIGTLDSIHVSCYVLVGGRALGLDADAGPDWGRDSTHLWHVHISMIRKFVTDQEAWRRVLSILRGETAAQYFSGAGKPAASPITQGDIDAMADNQFETLKVKLDDLINMIRDAKAPTGQSQTIDGGRHRVALFRDLEDLEAKVDAVAAKVDGFTPVTAAPVDPAAVQSAIATALAKPETVASLVKAINDDAARRAAD